MGEHEQARYVTWEEMLAAHEAQNDAADPAGALVSQLRFLIQQWRASSQGAITDDAVYKCADEVEAVLTAASEPTP